MIGQRHQSAIGNVAVFEGFVSPIAPTKQMLDGGQQARADGAGIGRKSSLVPLDWYERLS